MLGTNVYARELGVVFLKRSILDLVRVYVNGGRWGVSGWDGP